MNQSRLPCCESRMKYRRRNRPLHSFSSMSRKPQIRFCRSTYGIATPSSGPRPGASHKHLSGNRRQVRVRTQVRSTFSWCNVCTFFDCCVIKAQKVLIFIIYSTFIFFFINFKYFKSLRYITFTLILKLLTFLLHIILNSLIKTSLKCLLAYQHTLYMLHYHYCLLPLCLHGIISYILLCWSLAPL